MTAVIGIDVGTGSVRAGVFDLSGKMLGVASRDIQTWKTGSDFVEQSSDNIWQAVCEAVQGAMSSSGLLASDIKGVGFDATCSLVAVDEEGRPVTVSPSRDDARNIIVWMDHRATPQAMKINSSPHRVLQYVGGTISPEMETPKLLWLKENMPETWARTAHFFDLPDFLTWRASGQTSRSLCSTVCKWTYLGHEQQWDREYFESIGLGDLAQGNFTRIGTDIRPMGSPVTGGLSLQAATELGLLQGTPTATSIIDAHAGALGIIGASLDNQPVTQDILETRMALICGTSSCHMVVSQQAHNIAGVWGPYFSAMVPGMWLNEGGQSATGALIDHIIFSHARGQEAKKQAESEGKSIYQFLNERLVILTKGLSFPALLTENRHILPYFHGNRSPRANPLLRGTVAGLCMENSIDDLAVSYLATIQAIAYGTKHIIESMNQSGYTIQTIFACGGDCKNSVFLREHADILNCQIVLAKEPEAVLLGAATLATVAAGIQPNIFAAMSAMNHAGAVIQPAMGTQHYHLQKYAVFKRMHDDLVAYQDLMTTAG
jgi:FGGY-family pentulose kinase